MVSTDGIDALGAMFGLTRSSFGQAFTLLCTIRCFTYPSPCSATSQQLMVEVFRPAPPKEVARAHHANASDTIPPKETFVDPFHANATVSPRISAASQPAASCEIVRSHLPHPRAVPETARDLKKDAHLTFSTAHAMVSRHSRHTPLDFEHTMTFEPAGGDDCPFLPVCSGRCILNVFFT